jgi:transcriptional regulator with XRE-family HTH domain
MLRVKEICEEKNIALQDLAGALGITYQSLWSSLTGNPSLARLKDIASALNVPIEDLFVKPKNASSAVCPHCGKEIKIKLE